MSSIEPIGAVIDRVEAAIVASVQCPPSAEFGLALVKIADLRRLITELQRRR